MKIAYFDCIAGASGDMILGALVDAGLPLETLQERLNALHLRDFTLSARRVSKHAFSATKVDVAVADDVPERRLTDIMQIIDASDLSGDIKTKANAIFRRMGEVEAGIHGTEIDQVHLHELGGVDTIVDVVGALVGLQALGIERVVVSPIPLGRGFIRGAHGQIPLPAPATVGLLKGAPIVGSALEMETVTPTGAAVLTGVADAFGAIPAIALERAGYGAGSRDLPIPNVIRLLIGEAISVAQAKPIQQITPLAPHTHPHGPVLRLGSEPTGHAHPHAEPVEEHAIAAGSEDAPEVPLPHPATQPHSCLDNLTLTVLETNIDDLNPEFFEYVMERLFAAGALDVYLAPIQMKKNRPATLLRVLCAPDKVQEMTAILFTETSTLGIREHQVNRYALPRSIHSVDTPYGAVRVKVAEIAEGVRKCSPEYEDCKRLAKETGVALRVIYQSAQEIANATLGC